MYMKYWKSWSSSRQDLVYAVRLLFGLGSWGFDMKRSSAGSGDCMPLQLFYISRSTVQSLMQMRVHIPSQICLGLPPLISSSTLLVLTSRLLACLQLIQVPPANGQVAIILRHAVVEVLDVTCAYAGGL